MLKKRPVVKEDAKHIANCHWKGVFSIVLKEGSHIAGNATINTRVRWFVIKPDETPPEFCRMDLPFLAHAHSYDLTSTTILGYVENHRYAVWHGGINTYGMKDFGVIRYRFSSGIEGEPRLESAGHARWKVIKIDHCPAQMSYNMKHHEIHRPYFLPCPDTGWTVVQIRERSYEGITRPEFVYSELPCKDYFENNSGLYQMLSNEEAQAILDQIPLSGYEPHTIKS